MSNSDLTPGRTLTVTYDVPEPVLIEEAWSVGRKGVEIAPGQQGNAATGTFYWASGCWTLFPVQKNLHLLRERTNSLVVPLAAFTLIEALVDVATVAILAEVNQWKQGDTIPLVTYDSGVQMSGDPFVVKRVPANISSYQPIATALPLPPADTANVVMDRTAESTTTFPADQGLCFRWKVPGSPHDHADGVVTFYFGQYALYFDGTGRAHLWENPSQSSASGSWLLRDEWQFCLASQVTNVEHCLLVFPHKGPEGENILDFSGNALDISSPIGGASSPDAHAISASNHKYQVGPTAYLGSAADPAPGHVTMANLIRYDTRRDLRLAVQCSVLGFSAAGQLQDYAAALPPQTSAQDIQVNVDSRVPSTCSLTNALNDTDNNTAPGTFGTFDPGTNTKPFVQFAFSGDGKSTPILWGYTLVRPAVVEANAPGSFTGGITRRLALSGQSADPQQETGTLNISDVNAELTRFQSRGLLSCKIGSTLIDPTGAAQSSTLFRGYVNRPTATKRGRQYNNGLAFPDTDWRDYNAPLVGMWMRLAARVQDTSFRQFSLDPSAPVDSVTGGYPPYKVTDAIREMIRACGFTDAYIDIPDLPMRLWPTHDGRQDVNTVMPKVTLASHIQLMVRNYLGAYLVFDQNAGSDGQWRLLFAPQPDGEGNYTPVFNFVTTPAGYGSRVMPAPHLPGHYPSVSGVPSAPIIGSYTWQNIPPEYNLVMVVARASIDSNGVVGRVSNWAYNPLSYNVPGFTTAADPTHQDYLPGGCRTCIVVDASLGGAGTSVQAVQRSVDWTVRRVYDYVAHGQRIAHIRAPLSYILDSVTGKWRPLRALDPISINGVPRYQIKGVEASIQKSGFQFATYEVIAPFGGQYIRGGAARDFYRRAASDQSRMATAHATQSHEHALKSVTPASEQEILSLPDYGVYRNSLQNADGSFKGIAGY